MSDEIRWYKGKRLYGKLYMQRYRQRDYVKEAERIRRRKSWDELRLFWGGLKRRPTSKEIREIENLGCRLLELKDFAVMKTNASFPFDAIAKKNDQIYGVEITLSFRKRINKHARKLVQFLGWKVLVVFIKPDFSIYRVFEIPNTLTGIFVNNTKYNHTKFERIPKELKKTMPDIFTDKKNEMLKRAW